MRLDTTDVEQVPTCQRAWNTYLGKRPCTPQVQARPSPTYPPTHLSTYPQLPAHELGTNAPPQPTQSTNLYHPTHSQQAAPR